MPEIIEVEMYRRTAESAIGRRVSSVLAPDDWYLKKTERAQLDAAFVGETIDSFDRIGKLLVGELSSGHQVGLRFGMTGRLLVDDDTSIESLEYSSDRNDPAWDRFGLDFEDGGTLRMRDPRRLGGVELDPVLAALGPDAWTLTAEQLAGALVGSKAALKARLLDQSRVAGLGNLLTDEILWRSDLSPTRTAASLDGDEVDRLVATIASTLDELDRRGGSHTGDLQEVRHPVGHCPRDGAELRRDKVGGRTTVWCPEHQQ